MVATFASAHAGDSGRLAAWRRAWPSTIPLAAACATAVVFTLDGYNFGRGNQVEHLPAILRLLDERLLANDYFVNAFVEGGPRYYYFRLLAIAGSVLPLPLVFFVLTLAANAATLFITFKVTERAFNLVAAYASLFLLCVLHFYVRLGGAGFLLTQYLTPATIAIPCTLAAIGAAVTGATRPAVVFAILTAVVHPLYGLAAGGWVSLVGLLGLLRNEHSAPARQWLLQGLAPALTVAAAFLLLWYRKEDAATALDDATFFRIYARIRASHHLLPSRFPAQHWALFAGFTVCSLCFLASVWHRMRSPLPLLLGLAAATMLGFVAGYVLVEVIPIRSVLVLQLYRFTCLTSWVGIICAAGALGVVSDDWRARDLRAWRLALVALAFIALALSDLLIHPQRRAITPIVLLVTAIAACAAHVYQRRPAAVLTLAVVIAFLGVRFGVFGARAAWLGNVRPAFVLANVKTPYDDVMRFAREHTAADDVFLIADAAKGNAAGVFRYKAERALFADFKVFPYRDAEMAEWYARISELGKLRPQANDDPRLLDLAQRYGLAYGVLPKGMPSKLPVLFTGKKYFLVSLRDR